MRKLLLAAVIAGAAFAKDSGDAAFELLAKHQTEKQQNNYIKLKIYFPLART